MKPDHMDASSWDQLKKDFDHGMGWDGEDAQSTVRPTGINAESYVAQLKQAGFRDEDIEVIDLNPMYSAWQQAVFQKQQSRGVEDTWINSWLEQNQQSQALGFLIRAVKS